MSVEIMSQHALPGFLTSDRQEAVMDSAMDIDVVGAVASGCTHRPELPSPNPRRQQQREAAFRG
jgi:hypothetical protein